VLTQRAEIADFIRPSKLLGILAAGCAVVVTAHAETEVAKVLAEADSVVCRPGDASALSDEILRLAREPELRRKMGQNTRKFAVAHYTQNVVLSAFEAALRNKVSAPEHPGGEDSGNAPLHHTVLGKGR
jgi:glycosyltransferase involved in cell wall biosynthesis